MSLFFVLHQHTPETCPAKDPEMGNMLLSHLSQLNANKYGLVLQGDVDELRIAQAPKGIAFKTEVFEAR